VYAAALMLCGAVFAVGASAAGTAGSTTQQTTRDKVFTKEQAERGAALYAKHCDRCHDPAKVQPGKKPGPPTVGPKFIETWQDRTLGELYTSIFTTMPSDGSYTLTPAETLDVIAHILTANGFPAGTKALKEDDEMKGTVIVKGQRAKGRGQRAKGQR
jgi:mono/diheme cytochrome c family protein